MSSITGIRTVSVPVQDQDNALEFYVTKLGFEVRLDARPAADMRWIELAPAGVSTTVALDRAVGSAGIDTGIRFAVPDAQTEHRALSKRGVTVSEILRWDDAPPMFTFEDPDGNRFYVLEEQA